MPKIKLYKTPVCPYCVRAIALLKQKGVMENVEQIDITTNPEFREEMLKKSGGMKSVPQIFIDDKHIGGCDDLYALNTAGKLDELLKA
jgi:glutaredoxin 3